MSCTPRSSPLIVPGGLAPALKRLAVQADDQAWELIVREAGPHLWRIAYHLSSDAHAADDAMQEALLQVRDHARGFRCPDRDGDRAALRWMMSIAAHAVIGIHRRRLRRREQALSAAGDTAAPQACPSAADARQSGCGTGDDAARIREELGRLPAALREPLIMRYVSGMALSDVATTLGITVGNAKVRIHRGLRRLRSHLSRSAVHSLLVLGGALEAAPAAPRFAGGSRLHLLHAARTPTLHPPAGKAILELSMLSKCALFATAVCGIGLIPVLAGQEAAADAGLPSATSTGAALTASATTGATDAKPGFWRFADNVPAAERVQVEGMLNQKLQGLIYDGSQAPPAGQVSEVLDSLFAISGFHHAMPVARIFMRRIDLHLTACSIGEALAAVSRIAQVRFVYSGGTVFVINMHDLEPFLGPTPQAVPNTVPAARPGLPGDATSYLTALVSEVIPGPDADQALVTLNIGAADGASEKREFVVSRGQRYICRIRADRTTPHLTTCHVIPGSWNTDHDRIASRDVATNILTAAPAAAPVPKTTEF